MNGGLCIQARPGRLHELSLDLKLLYMVQYKVFTTK